MRNFLLLVLLCLPPLLLVGQGKVGVTYEKHVTLSGKNIKDGSAQDTMYLGGLSAIEYVPASFGKHAQWMVVSDAGEKKTNTSDKKSYSLMLRTVGLFVPTSF